MDINITVLCGRLATEPELRVFDSGARLIRYLITVKADAPRRRVDVIPVTLWDPTDEDVAAMPERGTRIHATGSVQRRYWEGPDGRSSRIEIIAEQINVGDLEDLEPTELPG